MIKLLAIVAIVVVAIIIVVIVMAVVVKGIQVTVVIVVAAAAKVAIVCSSSSSNVVFNLAFCTKTESNQIHLNFSTIAAEERIHHSKPFAIRSSVSETFHSPQ